MKEIQQVIAAVCKEAYDTEVNVSLTRPDEQFGDYATNVALQLSKQLGKNPREIAEVIAAKIRDSLTDREKLYADAKNDKSFDGSTHSWPEAIQVVKAIEVAGPGFLNIVLTDEALIAEVDRTLTKETSLNQTVLVEYSDPNPLKPLHAGHLYTTLVGDSIARLVERGGSNVVRLNYGGDVGLHVGKSIWAIIRRLGGELPQKLAEVPVGERAAWLGDRYVEGNDAYEDDEASKSEIISMNKKVYALHAAQDHESAFAQIYWTVRQWSYDYFAQLYEQLGVVTFDRFIPESEVTELGINTVRKHTGTVYMESDGAVIFSGEAHGLHTRVFINSEGLPTYEAKEVGLLETKWDDYRFDKSIVITANEQDQYMQVVLKSIAQFQPEPVSRTTHLTHGVVKLAGGVKMSSRKGNIVSALDILEAAREAGVKTGRAQDENIILAAIKYAFLKNRIGTDIIYDPAESVALEGNSGPYLQYAHARARSILSKLTSKDTELLTLTPGERMLVRKLTEYEEVIEKAAKELMPHHVCTYLYDLAQTFNRFYEQNRVLGDDRESERAIILNKYAETLKDGLYILGIHAPEKM